MHWMAVCMCGAAAISMSSYAVAFAAKRREARRDADVRRRVAMLSHPSMQAHVRTQVDMETLGSAEALLVQARLAGKVAGDAYRIQMQRLASLDY
ncbi:hypothetical protein [Antrihabitans sp. YC2-6]|uniref:hypothetical protein n=1 Tax=Antrihabitans sp. YC2-6 TaxID=2799498 RepID=UPI0018F351D1|nr:hypothetical protein [Antrihabitans sp. YC2-6]MBJ8347192.1 hypothetical protein [Antrihabitans sp. YC2-6]